MTIEGLGKKFQEARLVRNLTLDEAARMTKIRPTRLAEIEADDFSQFPSLAYAKGFLQIYGKFLDVDVAPYLEAFETSEHITVDGYSYLQEEPAPAAVQTPVVRRRPSRPRPAATSRSSSGERPSLMPVVIGIIVIIIGFWIGKLVVNLRRVAPQNPTPAPVAQTSPSARPAASTSSSYTATAPQPAEPQRVVAAAPPSPPPVSSVTLAPTAPPQIVSTPIATPPVVAIASPPPKPPPAAAAAPSEPEVRRAQPVRAEDLSKVSVPTGPNQIAIRPLKKTYIKVVIDNEQHIPAFERWISPSDGILEFRGRRVAIRVLDRDAIQIKKNGKSIPDDDSDVTIE